MKPIVPYNKAYVQAVSAYMRLTHRDVLNRKINTPATPAAAPELPPVWTDKQQKIIAGFRKWSYGCQHTEVAELVSLLTDIPVDTLTESPRKNRFHHNTVLFSNEYRGMFVKLRDKRLLSSSAKLPIGSVLYLGPQIIAGGYGSAGVTSDMRTVSYVNDIRLDNPNDMSWTTTFSIATPDEIDAFTNKISIATELFGRWDYFLKYFTALVEYRD